MVDVKPFWFCKLIVEHNTVAFLIAVLVQSSFVLTTVVLFLLGSNVLPIDFSDVPLILDYEPSYRHVASWNLRNNDPYEPIIKNPSFVTVDQIEQQIVYRQHVADVVELYYETTDGSNILSYKFLKVIADFEHSLMSLPLYDKFCVLNEKSACAEVDSITKFFPNLFKNDTPSVHDEYAEDENITKILIEYVKTNETMKILIEDYVNNMATLNDQNARSTSIRSYLLASWATYSAKNEPNLPTDTKDFGSKILSERFWNYSENGLPNAERVPLSFFYYNAFLYYDRLSYQCSKDQMLAIGSFLFIFVFLWFQTRSMFIAIFGMYSILTNFFGANLIYRYIFDYQYFGVFNALAIFLILAIGVDEIFVFEETWVLSKEHSYPSLSHRLSACYKKCSLSIFIPTVTTLAALIQNSTCPLLALSSFGLFAVNLVALNYLSIITYFPCILIFYHYHFDKSFCKCLPVKPTVSEPDSQVTELRTIEKEKKTKKSSDRFCAWYFRLVWSKTYQISVLIGTGLIIAFFVYQSALISTDERPPKLFTEKHLIGISLNKRTNEFRTTRYFKDVADFIRIYLIWGISGLDRSMCHKTNWTKCRGSIVWDNNFDLNSYTTQKELLEICRRIKSANVETQQNLRMKFSNGSIEIDCFIDQMDKYFNEELKSIFISERKYSGLPVTDTKVEALMMHVPQIFDVNELHNNSFFYRYFEIANLYWLNDGYKFIFPLYSWPPPSVIEELKTRNINLKGPIPQPLSSPKFTTEYYKRYASLLGHSTNSSDLQQTIVGNYTFVYGTKLRYAAIIINTTIPILNLRYQDGIALMDKWETYFNRLKLNVSFPLQGGIVATPDSNNDLGAGIWHWMKVQEMMVITAWQGIVFGLCLALPILVLFIDDLLLGTLATLMIAFVSVSIIGIIPLVGWKLGLLEALNITLVADLAIDHIVHIAEGYKLSTKTTRKEKVEELLREIGVSVLSGALTTLGASSFLFFSKIVFFMQFGLFIFITVGFSMIFALGTFVVLLALIGPEGDRYSMKVIAKKLSDFIMKRTKSAFKYVSSMNDDDSSNVTNPIAETNITAVSEIETDPKSGATSQLTLSLPNIANKKYPTYLVAIKNEDLKTSSKSIDDDNLSSGYESGSVKNLIVNAIVKETTATDLSDIEDNSESKKSSQQQIFRPKFTTIPEETKSTSTGTISMINQLHDNISVQIERTSDLPLSSTKSREEPLASAKIRGHLVSKSRQNSIR